MKIDRFCNILLAGMSIDIVDLEALEYEFSEGTDERGFKSLTSLPQPISATFVIGSRASSVAPGDPDQAETQAFNA